jgi:general secretion pathway protein G
MKKGFTLVEVLIVLTIIGILVAIILPIHRTAIIRAREAVLKENLFQIRDAINKYYYYKNQYPTSLDDLVTSKLMRVIPMDPIIKKAEWEVVHFEPEEMEDFDPEIAEGIIDVKSLSQSTALDGTKYNDW